MDLRCVPEDAKCRILAAVWAGNLLGPTGGDRTHRELMDEEIARIADTCHA